MIIRAPAVLAIIFLFLIVAGCGGGGGSNTGGTAPGTPAPENPDPVNPAPTPEPTPEPLTLNEQHRHDAGLDRIAPGEVWPDDHRERVRDKFAVIELVDHEHGNSIQTAACIGYAPDRDACTYRRDANWGTRDRVSDTPFTYVYDETSFPDEFGKILRQHPNLIFASLSVKGAPLGFQKSINDAGVVVVQGAGNDGVENWRAQNFQYWSFEDIPEQPGDKDLNYARFPEEGAYLMQSIAKYELLMVAGYEKDHNGNFIPHHRTTQCKGIDHGCLYAPYDFDIADLHGRGTSLSAPFVAAGLASVLAVFPETSGQDLIRLAKRCAVREPGLTNGLGRFSLACMDNGDTLAAGEETAATVSARSAGMARAFANTALPGPATFTWRVEEVPLIRHMAGSFRHSVGLIPSFPDLPDTAGLSMMADGNLPGVRIGTERLFLAASVAQGVDHFMGATGYTTDSINVAAGAHDAFLRYSRQEGEHNGGGVVGDIEGAGIGLTIRRSFDVDAGTVQPFVHFDRFTGGTARTARGPLAIRGSEWNTEAGIAFAGPAYGNGNLSVTVSSFTEGATGGEESQARIWYRLRY